MPDFATSADPAVQRQLDRLAALSPGRDTLGLERVEQLLARLGNPQRALPPVFHVAGTNGKGSTCAFLTAALREGGHRVHAYTSPHLVRFNERIRLDGALITDAALAALLAEVLDAADGMTISFFEVTTAAALLAFSRTPADACVIEVGLGGRLDATNVIAAPLMCGIASLGLDHEEFLLSPDPAMPSAPMARIAAEKAGIARAGVPLVTCAYPQPAASAVADVATAVGAEWLPEGTAWSVAAAEDHLVYRDSLGTIFLPMPALAGGHQARNAGLAAAMLRYQSQLMVDPAALARGIQAAAWPARLQRLGPGPLTAAVPLGSLWLDGGHNLDAAERLAEFFLRDLARRGPIDVVLGMIANKDAAGFVRALAPAVRHLVAVPVPGHDHHAPEALTRLAAAAGVAHTGQAADIGGALVQLAAMAADNRQPVQGTAILGSLYLAGAALRLNDELPV